jgi:YHS domain-containing protein
MKQLFIFFLFISFSVFSQEESKRLSHFNLNNKVAIQGYDPVAYFKDGKALEGKKETMAIYEGVVYFFSSVTNKEIFIKNPTAYEPQYGGWCAYAMGDAGEKVFIDPESFKILDAKLYLFYNAYFSNDLKSWNQDQANLKIKADTNWKRIMAK